jgi:hypothetical protein
MLIPQIAHLFPDKPLVLSAGIIGRFIVPRVSAAPEGISADGAAHRKSGSQSLLEREMQLDLTDEEAAALVSLLNRAIDDDRYPLSPRVRMLRSIRAKFPTAPPSHRPRGRRRPKNAGQDGRHALAGCAGRCVDT